MKRLPIILVLTFVVQLFSYVCWEESGKVVRQSASLNYSGSVISLDAGNYATIWSDLSEETYKMRVQMISAEGEAVWQEPVVVSGHECIKPQNELIVEIFNGTMVTAWTEQDETVQIRAQCLDQSGNLLWGEEGLVIEAGDVFPLRLVPSGSGVYFIWQERSDIRQIRAVYLDYEGNSFPGWNSSGNTLLTYSDNMFSILEVLPDGYGGIVFMTKEDYQRISLHRCNIQGIMLWGLSGSSADDLITNGRSKLLSWSDGEYVVIVERNENFWGNIIDFNGNFNYFEMQQLTFMSSDYNTSWLDAVVTSDGRLGLTYNQLEGIDRRLYAQKIIPGGQPEWGNSGILLSEGADVLGTAVVSADQAGGIYVNWDASYPESYGLYYQHLSGDGNFLIGGEPLLIAQSEKYFYSKRNIALDAGLAVIWLQHELFIDNLKIQIFDEYDSPLIAGFGNTIFGFVSGSACTGQRLASKGTHTAFCWQDSRYARDQIFVQVIDDNTGEFLFPEDGIAVTVSTDLSERVPQICFNDQEQICLTFTRDESQGVVQVIDLDGNRLLGENGEVVNSAAASDIYLTATAIENGFLVVWKAGNGDFLNPLFDLKVQKIENCEFVWGEGVTLVTESEDDIGNIAVSQNTITWVNYRLYENSLRMLKLDNDGNIAAGWEAEGLLLAEHHFIFDTSLYSSDEEVIAFWKQRNETLNAIDIFGQKISSEGEILWEESGRHFFEITGDYESFVVHDSYIYFITGDETSGTSFQKYDLSGEIVWALDVQPNNNYWISHVKPVFYEDKIVLFYGSENDLYAKIYDLDGNLVDNIPENGLEICTEREIQSPVSNVIDDNGNCIVLWKDYRGYISGESYSPSLYTQKIDVTLSPTYEDNIADINLVNLSNYPNPFINSTNLKCDLPRNTDEAEIVIYNIKGQKVRSLLAVTNEVIWDCRNEAGEPAGAGIYFYRIKSEGLSSKTGKMIMLR